MQIKILDGLAFTSATVSDKGSQLHLDMMLIDSGSMATALRTDIVERLGLKIELTDEIEKVRGVGGWEFVIRKRIDEIKVGDLVVRDFNIQLGALDYGMEIDGIIGLDFLLATRAVVNFKTMMI